MTHDFTIYGNNVYVAGDIHGRASDLASEISSADLRNAAIIILGDVGLGFGTPNNHIGPIPYLHRVAKDRNNHFYIFRGNHDNPESWNEEITAEIERKNPNVHYLRDMDVINLANGKTCLVVPGAISIDRNYAVYKEGKRFPRKRGTQYWENETIDYDKISEINSHYDYVLAHTGPVPPSLRKSSMIETITATYDPELSNDIAKERLAVLDIMNRTTCEKWVNGHYHVEFQSMYCQGDREFKEGNVTVLSLGIEELRKLD